MHIDFQPRWSAVRVSIIGVLARKETQRPHLLLQNLFEVKVNLRQELYYEDGWRQLSLTDGDNSRLINSLHYCSAQLKILKIFIWAKSWNFPQDLKKRNIYLYTMILTHSCLNAEFVAKILMLRNTLMKCDVLEQENHDFMNADSLSEHVLYRMIYWINYNNLKFNLIWYFKLDCILLF